MAKSNYEMKWYEFLISGIMSLAVALAVAFRWFSSMIGGRSYEEMGSSKTSGIAYAIGKLENSDWRFLLVAVFLLLSYVFFKEGFRKRG